MTRLTLGFIKSSHSLATNQHSLSDLQKEMIFQYNPPMVIESKASSIRKVAENDQSFTKNIKLDFLNDKRSYFDELEHIREQLKK